MKKIIFFSIPVLLILLICVTACNRVDENGLKTFGYEYFPLKVGDYNIYNVSDSIFSLSEPRIVVNNYQLMESVEDTFTDMNKDKVFQIYRYSRKDSLTEWALDSIWTSRLMYNPGGSSYNKAVKTENNIAFVKLVFPVSNNLKWNGNQLNSQNPPDSINQNNIYGTYKMVNINKPYLKYDSTLLVIQNNDTLPNNQKWEKKTERYATHYGMISKEKLYVEFDCADGTCSGDRVITFGYKIKYTLVKHGSK